MTEYKTLAQEQDAILERLRKLDKLDFPQYRSYQRADGTWVDLDPVSEYLEQEELIRRWREIRKIEQHFHSEHNPLMISLRLIADTKSMDIPLLTRIAISVYQNSAVS